MSASKEPRSVRALMLNKSGPLFHISLNSSLQGLWTPGTQAGFDTPGEQEDSSWPYPEAPMNAISLADSIENCFRGVFPNVARFFEVDRVPYLNFYVYAPVLKGHERVVPPSVLTNDGWVWDAHVTHEYRVLDPVEMKLIGEVEIANTNASVTLTTHPFNKSSNPRESVGPTTIRFKWVRQYK